jgi:hypothetical protein
LKFGFYNGLSTTEGGAFEKRQLGFAPKPIRITNSQFISSAPFLSIPC